MKRIFCDLCGEPAITYLERKFNHSDGRTGYISVILKVYFRQTTPSKKGRLSEEAGICLKCLKELLEPLSVSHTDDVKATPLRCPARMFQCKYTRGHKDAHRALQPEGKSLNSAFEVTWDSKGSSTP